MLRTGADRAESIRPPWRPRDRTRASVLAVVHDRADDAALMTAIATHADKQAFAELFRRYAPKVKAHLVARGAAGGVVDELTQEVMLVVWRKAALFDAGKGNLGTWLYAISRNSLLNQLRHDGRRGIELDAPDSDVTPPTGEQQVLAAERARTLMLSVEQLPPEQREVLMAAYWQGRTLQECAIERKLPLGTVKTRIHLAVARLRNLLSDRSDE
jgi:RNA polymerase sigma-70 factor (ECF subfamily)